MNLASRYGRSWRFLGRDLGYLLSALPIALVGFVVAVTLFSLGVSLAIVWIGVPILLAGLGFARGFASAELARLALAGHPLPRPDWTATDPTASLWRRDVLILADGRPWLALLHVGVVNIALALATWSLTITWLATILGGLSYGFWAQFLPTDGEKVWLHTVVFRALIPGYQPASTFDGLIAGESALNLGFALIALLTLAPLLRGSVGLHAVAARALLGETRGAALARAAAAEASRSAAILAEDAALRRLERDIHDGPQQALLRLQFDIASAERQLGPDDAHTRSLLVGALQLSKDTLDELREISQGLAPPLLQDRGLASAVRSLAGRSTVPVTTELELARPVPSEVERSAYFVVAELLANVAKHAGARAVIVRLTDADGTLEIAVSDDGVGGAHETPGHGLAGLHERVAGLRGTLQIGAGPGTTVTVRIPLS